MSTGQIGRCERLRNSAALAVPLSLMLSGVALAQTPEQTPAPQAPQSGQAQVYEPAFFARFAPKTAADMVGNIPGFRISGDDSERGFGQAKQNVLINGRRVSGKSNDAATALGRITAESVIRIEIVDGATLDIPGLSGQVANVIAKVDVFSGTWNQQTELRESLHPSFLNGSVNANGKAGGWSWSVGLRSNQFHNGHRGPTWVWDGAGTLVDTRQEYFTGAGEEPSINGTLTYESAAGSIANLNVSASTFNFIGFEYSRRRPSNAPHENVLFYIGEDDRTAEVGADYEFDFGPGRLKLIGLQRYAEEDDLFTEERWTSAVAVTGSRSDFHAKAGESIARAEYGFGAFGGDLQIAGEGAFNYLDATTEFAAVRQPDGSYVLAAVDGGNGRVEERRGETNLSYSRKLSDAWSLQSSLGVEYSEIGVTFNPLPTGATEQPDPQEFVRSKGFLALVWKATDDLDISLKGERRVGQLDFGDFVSAVEFDGVAGTTQTSELVPEQAWIATSEINQNLGAWGAVKLALESRVIDDVIDVEPVGASGQRIGNIGQATQWSVNGSGTINLDPIGWKGGQFLFNWRYQDSEIDDPLTGIPRELSGMSVLNGNMSIRWDVPDTDWTLVAGIEEGRSAAQYRLDQVSLNWTAPSTNFFSIENKDVLGMKVRLQVVNLNDTSENRRRTIYSGGRRINPDGSPASVLRTEEYHRTFGPIARLNISGTF
jgi:outer membrane receptor for ferrienterochelin and colicins